MSAPMTPGYPCEITADGLLARVRQSLGLYGRFGSLSFTDRGGGVVEMVGDVTLTQMKRGTEQSWAEVQAHLRRLPARDDGKLHRVTVPKAAIEHPREAGARESFGMPVGQKSDWRFPPEHDCVGVHVQGYGDDWIVHLDSVHPSCDLPEHIRRDAPAAWRAAGAAVGAVAGAALGRSRLGGVLGAGLGFLAAAVTSGKKR